MDLPVVEIQKHSRKFGDPGSPSSARECGACGSASTRELRPNLFLRGNLASAYHSRPDIQRWTKVSVPNLSTSQCELPNVCLHGQSLLVLASHVLSNGSFVRVVRFRVETRVDRREAGQDFWTAMSPFRWRGWLASKGHHRHSIRGPWVLGMGAWCICLSLSPCHLRQELAAI